MASFWPEETFGEFGRLEELEILGKAIPPSLPCFCKSVTRKGLGGGVGKKIESKGVSAIENEIEMKSGFVRGYPPLTVFVTI